MIPTRKHLSQTHLHNLCRRFNRCVVRRAVALGRLFRNVPQLELPLVTRYMASHGQGEDSWRLCTDLTPVEGSRALCNCKGLRFTQPNKVHTSVCSVYAGYFVTTLTNQLGRIIHQHPAVPTLGCLLHSLRYVSRQSSKY